MAGERRQNCKLALNVWELQKNYDVMTMKFDNLKNEREKNSQPRWTSSLPQIYKESTPNKRLATTKESMNCWL